MPKNDIGGFFVSLGLNPDKASFETGNKLVDAVGNSFNKLIGAARNAAVVLAGTAVASGMVESAAYKTAEKIGISTETLDLWKASAKIAGVDANGLVSAMGSLANVMGRMRIDGAGLEQFSKKMAELGLVVDKVDIAKMLDMAPDELMTDILRKAQEASAKVKKEVADANKELSKNPKNEEAQKKLRDARKEQQRISIIVGDVLGDAGQDFFIELQRQGKSIDDFLSGAGRTVFTTAADNQKGANFAVEVNTLKTEIESASKLLGDAIGGELTQYVKELNQWIQENGPAIRKTIEEIAKFTSKAVGETVDITGTAASGAKAVIDLATADNEEAKQAAIKKGQETVDEWKSWKDEGGAKGLLGSYVEEVDTATEKVIGGFNAVKNWLTNINKEREDRAINAQIAKKRKKDLEEAYKIKNKDKGWFKKELLIPGEDIDPDMLEAYRGQLGDKVVGKYVKLQDGIMRPDGTVTQVAPDDWVFAARNLGDLAKAFVPQNIAPEAPAANIAQPLPDVRAEQSPETLTRDSQPKPEKIAPPVNTVVNENITQNYSTESKATPLLQNEPEEPRLIRESPTKPEPAPLVQERKSDFMTNTMLTDLSAYVRSLSAAFIPQTHAPTSAPSEYVIHQTFNISGGNDMPQVIKEQAYRGTQDGLLQLMNKSSQRLQLMSGIR